MTETNPFGHFIPASPALLILGSFPCYNGRDYGHWFYSGSGRNHLWTLLGDVYGLPVNSLEEKKALCERYGIALTDIALRVRRKKGTCADNNLDIVEYNRESIAACLKANIRRVMFTSRFVQHHFFKLFPDCTLDTALLPSPSPAANRHLGGLEDYKQMRRSGVVSSVYDYRLMKYRQLLLPERDKSTGSARTRQKAGGGRAR